MEIPRIIEAQPLAPKSIPAKVNTITSIPNNNPKRKNKKLVNERIRMNRRPYSKSPSSAKSYMLAKLNFEIPDTLATLL